MAQDALERAFLAELEALEKFRISYSGAYPSAPLAHDDPDVRRLIEAMAMFTARTRLAAERSVDRSLLRVFRQHFPYLLGPVPAMAMLRAGLTARFVDVAELPRGTEVYLIRPGSQGVEDQIFRFRTLAKLRILPIELGAVDTVRVRGKGHRLLLRFASAFPRNDEIGELRLHINHLDDLMSSLTVFYELRTHLRAASVIFDKVVREDTRGAPCEAHFGAPPRARDEIEPIDHPLHDARAFLRFPRQELYLTLKGIRAPRGWREFTVCLDVDEDWPEDLRLTPDGFELHAVPMTNLRRDTANPIECDGTRDRYAVRHPDESARYAPAAIHAAYRMAPEGLSPLEPSVVGGRHEGYEAELEGKGADRRAWVALTLPDAFEKPERISVEALWHQPALRGLRAGELRVKLAQRLVDGVAWSCSGPLVAHAEDALEDDRDGLLQLLSIKNQRFLGRDDLAFLLRALGTHREPHFAKLLTALLGVEVTSKPYARRTSGFKYIYELSFGDLEGSDVARLDLFCRELLLILGAWSVEEVVEVVARVPNLGRTLRYS